LFDVSPISGTFGAEVYGVDVAEPLSKRLVEKLTGVFLEYKVLVFRDQHAVGPQEQRAFACNFGAPEIHPYLHHVTDVPEVSIHESDGSGAYGKQADGVVLHSPSGIHETWHTDGSTRQVTSWISFLRAVDVPPYGRDTVYADMEAVFEGLSPATQSFLEGLKALHSWGISDPEAPPIEQPVVITNRRTKRKALYINRGYTRSIVGMGHDESEGLLRFLFDRCRYAEYQIRVRWHPGTIVMWDNENTQHYLVLDKDYPRVMHRIMVTPELPNKFKP